jgi:hypothetical protein
MALMLLNTYLARSTWYTFGDRPYPALDSAYKALIAPISEPWGRILTRPAWDARSPIPGFFRTQVLNFPTVTGSFSLAGYDTFVEASSPNRRMIHRLYSNPLAGARHYGVRWLIWDQVFSSPVFSANPMVRDFEMPTIGERSILLPIKKQSSAVLAAEGVQVYSVKDSDPLAFVQDDTQKKPLPLQFDMRGATVQTAGISPARNVVVNILWRPWMKAFADGRATSCEADDWGRVVVPLDADTRTLSVFYCPPWLGSSLAGLGIAAFGAIFGLFLKKSNPG